MITAALPYANGLKHIGHLAGAYLPADIYVRYLKAQQRDVVFVCGSDEHGTAIPIQATKEGTTAQAIIDKYHPKWVIGFSDITILHAALQKQGIHSIHGPMSAGFGKGDAGLPYIMALKQMLEGAALPVEAKSHPANLLGHSKGILVGGNLCLFTHLIGGENQLDTKGKILCIEDVGEYHYNVDRMLIQCKNAGLLDGLAGLVVGGFTDMKDDATAFGETVIEMILRLTKGANYPICFDFPISHELNNMPVQLGATYQLAVTENAAVLTKI